MYVVCLIYKMESWIQQFISKFHTKRNEFPRKESVVCIKYTPQKFKIGPKKNNSKLTHQIVPELRKSWHNIVQYSEDEIRVQGMFLSFLFQINFWMEPYKSIF